MNDREGRSRPQDGKPARVPERTAEPGQSEEEKSDLEPTRSGAGERPEVDPTIQIDPTMSYGADATESAPKPSASKETVLMPSTKPVAPKEGQVIANRFIVRRLLGQGGMGRVYAVQDKQIEGRDVALKVLLPKYSKNAQFRKLFFQEVRAAQGFVSEYICQVRDTGETEDGSLFLTMDLIEGESLRGLLDREKVLGARQALEITRQVLMGLQSGHDKGFVHRDIKPPNVMLRASEPKTDDNPYGVAARLLDFGIAGLASEIDERSRAGTVMYMSPEQAAGERLDPRSDLFAVGVLLFEMLSGHRPFEGSSTRALVQSVLETNLTERLSEIPNLSKAVRRLLERALQKERDKRFQSANEFAEAIEASSAYKLPKEVPRWAYAGLGVLFVAAGAEAFMLQQASGENRTLSDQVQRATAEQLAAVKKAEAEKYSEIVSLEARRNALEGERDEWKNKYDSAEQGRIEVQGKLDNLSTDLSSKTDDKSQWDAQIDDLKGQLQSERDAKSNLSERLTKLEDSEKIWRERAEKAEAAKDEALRTASPMGQLAMTFDRVCDLVEQGLGQQALKSLQKAQDAGIFAKAGIDGADMVSSLAQSAALVHTYRNSALNGGTPQLRDIVEAGRYLTLAEKEAPSFALEGAAWIDFQSAGQKKPDRSARAGEIAKSLRKAVDGEMAKTTQDDASDAAAIDLSKLSRDATAIFAHADRYGCKEHLSKAAEKLVDELRSSVAPNQVLDVERLQSCSALPEWVKRFDQSHFSLDAARTADLRAFEFAQRWYGESNGAAKLEWNFAAPPVPTAPTSDWRQVLYLEWQLGREKANFPIKPGRTVYFRRTEPKKALAWDSISSLKLSRLELEYQAFDEQGFQVGTPDERELEFVEGVLRIKGSDKVIVDLRGHGPTYTVVPFPIPPESLVIPSSLVGETDARKFRDYLKSHPQACLAVVETSQVRWFSPEFGLVVDEISGGRRREVVSASSIQ
jgi:serine/threonine protein kinase